MKQQTDEMAKVLIRDARYDETERIADLLVEAYKQYGNRMPADEWQFYMNDIMDVKGRWGTADLIVAEINHYLAGTVTLYYKAPGSPEEWWPEGWAGIRLLAVHPDHRGSGIGRMLMYECIKRCKEHGVKTIGLHTTKIMEIARSMYERMGFTRIPQFDFQVGNGVVVMAYRLDICFSKT